MHRRSNDRLYFFPLRARKTCSRKYDAAARSGHLPDETADRATAAAILGLKPEQVAFKTMLAGGSFGRRATLPRTWRRKHKRICDLPFARACEGISGRTIASYHRTESLTYPSSCTSPARGEGTLLHRSASKLKAPRSAFACECESLRIPARGRGGLSGQQWCTADERHAIFASLWGRSKKAVGNGKPFTASSSMIRGLRPVAE